MNLEECLKSPSLILSSDPAFRILEDGTIYTTHDLLLSSEKRGFSILLSDGQGQEQKKLEIVLSAREKKVKHVRAGHPFMASVAPARLTSSLNDSLVFCPQRSPESQIVKESGVYTIYTVSIDEDYGQGAK